MPRMYDPNLRLASDILWRLAPLAPAEHGVSEGTGHLPADQEDEIGVAYREHYPLLAFVGYRRFRFPHDEIRPIVHEVFVSFIRNRPRVHDVRSWLVAAMCNRCRDYWRERARAREGGALSDFASIDPVAADRLVARLDVVKALRQLNPKCLEVLRLRFVDALSSAAIAEHYATTVAYARKMVYRCASAVRTLLSNNARPA